MDEKQIKHLLQDYIKGTISSDDEKRLEALEGKVIAKNLQDLSDSEEAKQRVLKKVNRSIKSGNNQRQIAALGLKIAASLLVVLTVSYLLLRPSEQPVESQSKQIVWIEKSTKWGEKLNLTLPDGSKVKLNSGSSIIFPQSFEGEERRVELKGEAFFDVTRIEQQPFVIQSGEVYTTVLGTSFNVNAYDEQEGVSVSVLTGRVRVASGTDNVYLTPKEQGVYSRSDGQIRKERVEIERVLFWKEGILHYEDATLQQVATSLERWFGVEISISNENLKQCHLTATYQNESLETILNSMVYAKKGMEYRIDPTNKNRITFSGRCNE